MVTPPVPTLDMRGLLTGLTAMNTVRPEGRVHEVTGLAVKSVGPHASIGDLILVESANGGPEKTPVPCEVVGFQDRFAISMPLERTDGIRPGARVLRDGPLTVMAGYSLKGRILDGLARPIDGGPRPQGLTPVEIDRRAPDPLRRERLSEPLFTGIRAIDGLLTCARGQRIGVFSGSGVGKSVLMGSLARHSSATVNVVALIGERGREVRDFIETCLGTEGLARSVVVTVTCDSAPVMRIKGACAAMAIAEYFRDRGENVLFLMDSVTRYAMAQREIGLAVGEPPTTKGYPPSVYGMLARLLERSGTSDKGSITAMYTVLVEADDMNDPVADTVRSILDGHIVLSRDLAAQNHYPAIDVLNSVSRTMNDVITPEHRRHASKARSLLATYRKAEDLINVGAYVKGSNPRIDEAIRRIDAINGFLTQAPEQSVPWEESLRALEAALG